MLALALLLGLALTGCDSSTSSPESAGSGGAAEEAVAAAAKWLRLVDEGNYDESWAAASEAFHTNMARFGKDEEAWVEALGVSRAPLGEIRSRTVIENEEGGGMPGGPEGRYRQIEYESHFEKKSQVRETIVMTLERDGAWRMFNYLIDRSP